MVFSSSIFLFLFLPVTLAVNFLFKKAVISVQNCWLLIVSLLFYFWGEPKNLWIMLLSITINYAFGMFIHLAKEKFQRKFFLVGAVVMNLALLVWFKYMNFAVETVNQLTGASFALPNIILPIGISFFTFQGMTYVIDLYWGNVDVQKNPLKIALYISLFPQLVAGPIVRYKDVAAQIDHRSVSLDSFHSGIQRFILGLGKKVILSNTVAKVVDDIFALPYYQNSSATAWLGILCYTFQIYFDFSGYSDMAIGLGKMFGFNFLENFDYPYISKSISAFWRRWHISLSSFFRDYVYIPLGGNRQGNVYLHLFIVFLLTGLWHGASWNFVIWGLWHGFFMLAERFLRTGKRKLPAWIDATIGRVYTLLVVIIGWVLFRAENIWYALGYLRIMIGLEAPQQMRFTTDFYLNPNLGVVLFICFIASIPILPWLKTLVEGKISSAPGKTAVSVVSYVSITAVFFVSLVYILNSSYNPFIYFRF